MQKRGWLVPLVLTVLFLVIIGTAFASLTSDTSAETAVSSQETVNEPPNDLDGLIEEVDKRQINSKHYLDPVNKLHKAIIDMKPIHYKDNKGKWQDIVLELKDSSDSHFSKEYHQGDISIKLSEKSRPQDMVSIKNKDKELTFAPIDDSSVDITLPRNVNKDLQTPNGAFGTRAANFENVYQDIDFRYELKQDALKEIIYINKPTTKNVFKFLIKANGLDAKLNSDNSVSFTDSQTNSLFFDIQKSFATDSSNKPEVYKDLTTSIEKQGSHYILTLTLDPSWLSDPERVYPIIIDPTTKYYIQGYTDADSGYGDMTGKAAKVYEYSPTTNYTGDNLSVGENANGYDWDMYVQVNPTNAEYILLSDKRILSAEQELYMYGQSDTSGRTLVMYKLTGTWGEGSITWNNIPSKNSTSIASASTGTPATLEDWKTWNITSTFNSWQSSPTSNHGLLINIDNNNYDQYKQFYGDEYEVGGNRSAKRPKLTVKYTSPPVASIVTPTGDQWTTDSTPTLDWNFSDPDGDAQNKYRVQVSPNSNFSPLTIDTGNVTSSATAYTPSTSLADGTYYWRVTVYDSYDWSGWTSSASNNGKFKVDSTAPTGTVKVNNDESYTNRQDVIMSSSASDNFSGMTNGSVRFSDTTSFSGSSWVTYATTKSYNLPTGDGTKTVYAQFKDVAGNISSTINDQIILDPNDLGLEKSIATYQAPVPLHVSRVNLSSGNLNMSTLDLYLSSMAPGSLTVERTYNSKSTQSSAFGPSWMLALPKISTSATDLFFTDESGAKYVYQKSGTSSFIRPVNQSLTMELINGKYVATALDREKMEFDSSGKLIKRYDLNGNTSTYSYDQNSNLTKIADDAGQEINLTYNNNLLTGLQDSTGRGVTYSYNQGYLTQVVGYDNQTTSYSYSSNKINSITDTMSNSYSLAYYGDGKFYGVFDPELHLTSLTYAYNKTTATLNGLSITDHYLDNRGRQTKFVNPLTLTTSYSYDSSDNQISETDALGISTTYTFDSFGRELSSRDFYGGTETSQYDSEGNMIMYVDKLGATTSYEYDTNGNMTSETDANEQTTYKTYDARGNLETNTNPLLRVTTTSYDDKGNLDYQTDELGNEINYQYDEFGNKIKEISPLGATMSYSYNILGMETSITDAMNVVVKKEYDEMGREVISRSPDGQVATTSYNELGQVVSVETPLGMTVYSYDDIGNKEFVTSSGISGSYHYIYDPWGYRLVGEADQQFNTTSYDYDALNRQTQIEDAQHNITSMSYDPLGRVEEQTNPEGETSSSKYNAAGDVVSTTNPKGETTTTSYDVMGKVTAFIYPDLSKTTYSYDALGNKIGEKNPNGAITTYEYTPTGQLDTHTSAGMQSSYTYDSVGHLSTSTDPNGNTTSFNYDNLGMRMENTIDVENNQTTINYDSIGRVTSEHSAEGTTSYSYNSHGLLSSAQEPNNDPIGIVYDENGKVLQRTVFNRTFSYTYDDLMRPVTIYDSLAGLFSSSYDNIGRTVVYQRPNQTKSTHAYDKASRLTELSTFKNSAPTNTFKYGHDDNGNRITTVENTSTNSYSYDAKGQMTASIEKVTHSVYPHTKYAWYTYDVNGNREQMKVMISTSGSPSQGASIGLSEIVNSVIASSSAFDTPDVNDNVTQALEFLLTGQPFQKQLSDELIKAVRDAIAQAPFTYEYTIDSSDDTLTSVFDPVTSTSYSYSYDMGKLDTKSDYYGQYSYTWDNKSRLTQIVRTPSGSAPALTVSYSYDSKDRRTMAIINRKDSATKSISTTHSYSYSESSLMEEAFAKTTIINGQPTTENHTIKYTPGSAITLDNTTYYYVNNGHGDIKEITDTNGDTVVKYSYDAWGNLTNTTPSVSQATSLDTAKKLAELNPYTYANYHYEGTDTGLYYLKARYYDPVIGRFINMDPMHDQNMYHYTANNPINAVDPSGMRLFPIKKGTSGNVVAVLQDLLNSMITHSKNSDYNPKSLANMKTDLNGDFNQKTHNAVGIFQHLFMGYLPKYQGYVDRKTWRVLLNRSVSDNALEVLSYARSQPCRDYNGYADGGWDTGWKEGMIGADCYYSIYWLGKIGYNEKGGGYQSGRRSVCEFAERNVAIKQVKEGSQGLWKANYAKLRYSEATHPIAYSRFCSWNGDSYPQICSEYLDMKKIVNWRNFKIDDKGAYKRYNHFESLSMPLLRNWPGGGGGGAG